MKSLRKVIIAALGALLLAGCVNGSPSPAQTDEGANANGSFPVTVESCGEELEFDKPPERVVMLTAVGASVMGELDVLDRVVARAGELDTSIYPEETKKKLDDIEQIDSGNTATGGAKLSTESVLGLRADLVIGYDSGVDRKALEKSGVKLYSPDAYCDDYDVDKADFDLVKEETTRIGDIFGESEKAKKLNAETDKQVDELNVDTDDPSSGGAYYVNPGSDEFTSYGSASMVQPIFDHVGLKNIYSDMPKRKLRLGMEAVLDEDPEWIVLLYGEGSEKDITDTFLGQKGADALRAVNEDKLILMPFPYTDPPSPLSIKGVEQLRKAMSEKGKK